MSRLLHVGMGGAFPNVGHIASAQAHYTDRFLNECDHIKVMLFQLIWSHFQAVLHGFTAFLLGFTSPALVHLRLSSAESQLFRLGPTVFAETWLSFSQFLGRFHQILQQSSSWQLLAFDKHHFKNNFILFIMFIRLPILPETKSLATVLHSRILRQLANSYSITCWLVNAVTDSKFCEWLHHRTPITTKSQRSLF